MKAKLTVSVRTRMSFIVSIGLVVLIASTILITLILSEAVSQDDARLGLLDAASAASFESSAQVVLRGNAQDTLPPEEDEAIKALLNRAITTHDAASLGQAAARIRLRRADNAGMVRGMFAALFVSSLVFLLVGLWFMQQVIVAPVEQLERIANRIASGDLTTPVVLEGPGEFLELSRSFESMRQELLQSHEQFLRFTHELETHVAQRTQQLTALSQVVSTASQSLELDTVLRTALAQSLQVVNVEMGGLWLIDEAAGNLRLAVSLGLAPTMLGAVSILEMGEGATGRAAASQQTIQVIDALENPTAIKDVAIHAGIRSLVAVPIHMHERVVGVLDVMTQQPRVFSPEEIVLLTSIGQQIGIAVDSIRLMQAVRAQAQQVAALQERERIGIELHDGVLQTLGYLFLKLDQLETLAREANFALMADQLAAHRTLLQQVSQDLRSFIADLRTTRVETAQSFTAALRQQIDKTAAELGIAVAFSGDEPALAIDSTQEGHLVKIVCEALTNAAQHGHARRASVTLKTEGDCMELQIQDDGIGFDPAHLPEDGREHFGLNIMRARAARIGGTLEIESRIGQGTLVCVTLPQRIS